MWSYHFSMAFIPEEKQWIDSHINFIPDEVVRLSGDLPKVSVLDVGCGDMLADFGLLNKGVRSVIGLDVHAHEWDVVEQTAERLRQAGFPSPDGYAERLKYVSYDGREFPFPDATFDFIYSWSAFEHIPDVTGILREIRRVMTDDGRAFLQVYPWFSSYWGSHLADFISEPFFHLTESPQWVLNKLLAYVAEHPTQRDFLLGHMWQEYQTLNKFTARAFIAAILSTGFCIDRLETIVRHDHLEALPSQMSKADAMAAGTLVLLRSGK